MRLFLPLQDHLLAERVVFDRGSIELGSIRRIALSLEIDGSLRWLDAVLEEFPRIEKSIALLREGKVR